MRLELNGTAVYLVQIRATKQNREDHETNTTVAPSQL